jgi:integrase
MGTALAKPVTHLTALISPLIPMFLGVSTLPANVGNSFCRDSDSADSSDKGYFRSFRTMHSSPMLREGERPEMVRDNMGHANIDVTQNVYGKSWWEERVDAIAALTLTRNRRRLVASQETVVAAQTARRSFHYSSPTERSESHVHKSR